MAALAPPPNIAGIPLPPVPGNPALLSDITNAKEYVERLSASKAAAHQHCATDDDIGAAEVYKTSVIFSHAPSGNTAPPWLANLNATVQQISADVAQITANVAQITTNVAQITADVAHLHQRADQLPILFANAQAGNRGPLYNPTAMVNGWAPRLTAPDPETRNELLNFTAPQCIASAAHLGLPVLPHNTHVHDRRRQIAVKIGVTID